MDHQVIGIHEGNKPACQEGGFLDQIGSSLHSESLTPGHWLKQNYDGWPFDLF
jgi:hypothetical protein